MRQFKVLTLTLLAVLALGSFAAASAGALPIVLPEAEGKNTITTSIGEMLYETVSGTQIKCLKTTGTATEEAPKPLGLFHINFNECTRKEAGVTVKCTGLGDATVGEILALGIYHLVYEKEEKHEDHANGLPVAILFLFNALHFTCGGIALLKVEGSEACLILEPYVLKELFEFHCFEKAGVSEGSGEYLSDEGKGVKYGLKSTMNEGTAEGAAESALALVLALLQNEVVDILIMMG